MKWCHSFLYYIPAKENSHAHEVNQIDMKEVKMYIWKTHITWVTVVWSMLLSESSYTHLSERCSADIVETAGHGSVVNWPFKGWKSMHPSPTVGHRNRIDQHICNTPGWNWTSHKWHLTTSAYKYNTNYIHIYVVFPWPPNSEHRIYPALIYSSSG